MLLIVIQCIGKTSASKSLRSPRFKDLGHQAKRQSVNRISQSPAVGPGGAVTKTQLSDRVQSQSSATILSFVGFKLLPPSHLR